MGEADGSVRLELNRAQLGLLYPAHILLGEGERIAGTGPAMQRLLPAIAAGDPLDRHLRIASPARTERLSSLPAGSIVHLEARQGGALFAGSAWPTDQGMLLALDLVPGAAADLTERIQFADFAPSDHAASSVLLIDMQHALLEEARSIAAELAEERQRSVELLENVSRAAGYLAHNFNNLLSVIALNVRRLGGPRHRPEERERLVDIILGSAAQGSELTRSLMNLSHRQQDVRSVLEVDAFLRGNSAFHAATAGSGIVISYDLQAGAATANVSRTGLASSLLNLLLNARDAMEGVGSITISTSAGLWQGRPTITIEVRDDGPGMSAGQAARAFDPLYSTKPAGTGLGLASVRSFAVAMGGEAELLSAPGRGTAARLYLPRDVQEESAASGLHPLGSAAGPGRPRILLVDDEPYALEALAELLDDEGFDTTCAQDHGTALAALQEGRHDLLLTDVLMPGTDGTALAAAAQQLDPSLQVVLMSGFVPDEGRIDPAWHFVRKPIDPAALIRLLQSVCPQDAGGAVAASGARSAG